MGFNPWSGQTKDYQIGIYIYHVYGQLKEN